MLKKVLFSVSAAAIGFSALIPCRAAAPMKVASVAPVANLVAEVDIKIKALETALADDQSYVAGKASSIPNDAGVLAVLSQAIVESEEKADWKGSAPDLRDGAAAVLQAKSYDDAKKGLAAIKDAAAGKAGGAKPEADWSKLCKLGTFMKESQKRSLAIRRATAKAALPPDTSELERHASVLAVLALAAHDDTHEVKNAAEIPEWQKYAKEFATEMTATATAFKNKDKDAAKAGFTKANQACNKCHEKFRME